jgi:hypothetical protein
MKITHDEIVALLPKKDSIITKIYNSFERGDLRVIVLEPDEPYEKRYTLTEVEGKPVLRHMP